MNEIMNAKIIRTELGYEDHGIMSCMLHVEGDGWGCGFGGYMLDDWNAEKKCRVGTAQGLEAIMQLMKALEVEKWEDLKDKYIRCEIERTGGGRITKVGHLIKDQWFSFEEFLNKENENE